MAHAPIIVRRLLFKNQGAQLLRAGAEIFGFAPYSRRARKGSCRTVRNVMINIAAQAQQGYAEAQYELGLDALQGQRGETR